MDSARSLAAATGTPMPATALPHKARHCPCMARDGRATARRSAAEPAMPCCAAGHGRACFKTPAFFIPPPPCRRPPQREQPLTDAVFTQFCFSLIQTSR